MQGFLRQRGSSWELRVYLGRDAVTGRKRLISRTFKGGKRDAQRALAALVAEADRGALARTTATVGELLEEWLAHASPGFSPKNAKETRVCSTANCSRTSGRSAPLRCHQVAVFWY
jgi:hypothetical protein